MYIAKIFKRIKSELTYFRAVTMADNAHSRYGCDYFVMPTESGKLIVINKEEYRLFRNRKWTPREVKARDLYRECLYHTSCNSHKAKVAKKRKYLRWKGLY